MSIRRSPPRQLVAHTDWWSIVLVEGSITRYNRTILVHKATPGECGVATASLGRVG